MHPGGYYPRASAPPGRYGPYGNGNGNGGGGGFRYGRGPPHRPPAPPEHQMTPREKEQVLMAAGSLAAEYLVDRGDLPPDVLENRPPAPIPFQQQGPPAFRFRGRPPPQHHRQFNFQGHQRPPAPQRLFPGPRPFQFQGGGHGPFPKRPRHQGPPRSFPYGPRAPAPPPHNKKTGYAGQQGAAAAPVAESEMQEDTGNIGLAGEAVESPPTAQTSGAQQMEEPSSSSLGANDSKSS
ncbi:hypothetical protein SETIT_1G251200v2 [Setaria italica]|uniref:Uncharacterized protein n=1 Tax=Setaria italica TaxID=4555 RepID=A0A368PQ05_SETIT|nr:hypothetical protein SETIT_1G251200v2 [Setaria italica]